MAKKQKKAEEVTPEVNSTENTNETENTVEPTEETPECEESYEEASNGTEETTTEETVELVPVEPAVDPTPEEAPIIIHEEPVVIDKSPKQMFEEAIAKIPFIIYQNNIMICHSNPHLVIKTEAKYFEINFKKYSYAGIEVKHK